MIGKNQYFHLSYSCYFWINVSETTPQEHEEIFVYADDAAVIFDNMHGLQDVARRYMRAWTKIL